MCAYSKISMTCITITCISLLHNYTESRKCDIEKNHGDGTLYHRLYITVVIHMIALLI